MAGLPLGRFQTLAIGLQVSESQWIRTAQLGPKFVILAVVQQQPEVIFRGNAIVMAANRTNKEVLLEARAIQDFTAVGTLLEDILRKLAAIVRTKFFGWLLKPGHGINCFGSGPAFAK